MPDDSFQCVLKPGRICPMPIVWNRLYQMLPDTRRIGDGREPPVPLILGAWHHTTKEQKHARFLEHLRWAESHGILNEVLTMLSGADPDEWLTEE